MQRNNLNIGCGNRYLDGWENLDANPAGVGVRRWNVSAGLPYPDGVFGTVYLSHLLEHLSRREAAALLAECRRVLRPAGVLRVVVPDLEIAAANYLAALRAVREAASGEARDRYEWACMLLLDQITRVHPGGLLGERLHAAAGRLPDYVRASLGEEWTAEYLKPPSRRGGAGGAARRLRAAWRWRRRVLAEVLRRKWFAVFPAARGRAERRRMAAYMQSGERHQWMYDGYSLGRMLEDGGFVEVARCECGRGRSAAGDDIRKLEIDAMGGGPYKPDSVFMEGLAPA